jgi:hypothetical protein
LEEIRILDNLSHTLAHSRFHYLLHFTAFEKSWPAAVELILGKFDVLD